MFKKFLLIGLLPLFALGANIVNAANDDDDDDDVMTKASVISMFTEFGYAIAKDQKNEEQITFSYPENAAVIAFWLKTKRFIEVDTEIDKSWFEKIAKTLVEMGKCKSFMVSFIRRDDIPKSAEYQKVKRDFEAARKHFDELLKHPTPVDPKKLEKLRAEKYKSAK